MKDLNYISHEITKKRNLEVNLERYSTGMASMYNGLAYIKLSMNYYTVYDMQKDGLCEDTCLKEMLAQFHAMTGTLLSGGLTEAQVAGFRDEVIAVMEVVTAYVDRFRIYEYVLNRIEHRFKEGTPDLQYYNSRLTNDLMHYILSDQDNIVIHNKISEVVEQLPMRLSRTKFYEYVREAFTLYHGAQKGTIDDFAYALRTTAGACEPEGFSIRFPELYDLYKVLTDADYTQLDETAFRRLSGALQIGVEKVTACADSFVLLAQMINDIYTIVLTQPISLGNVAEVENAKAVIEAVRSGYNKGMEELSSDVLKRFVQFEGKQEHILMIVSQCDFAVSHALENCQEQLETFAQKPAYEALSKTLKLQSGSDFMSLAEAPEKETVPSDEYADYVCEELIETLDTLFKKQMQPVRRAVMAEVLAQLPVFFNNTEEIQSYINVSLMQCNDAAEQAAVIEVFKMIMSDGI